jgi:hypothetical protein
MIKKIKINEWIIVGENRIKRKSNQDYRNQPTISIVVSYSWTQRRWNWKLVSSTSLLIHPPIITLTSSNTTFLSFLNLPINQTHHNFKLFYFFFIFQIKIKTSTEIKARHILLSLTLFVFFSFSFSLFKSN